ncbi:MAG: cytochrome C [Betaproteobacteria bacterium]|nr:MAG: cytochrome C [Betaproteobacteria bacterium]
MAKFIFCLLLTVAMSMTSGCDPRPDSGKGFTLPEGDAEAGKANYIRLQCNACHTINGVDQIAAEGKTPELSIALGGEVTRVTTYGDLVTSIINPSHRLARGYPADVVSVNGKSKMKNYNDVMTVSQLVDLVVFLESKYTLVPYERTVYPLFPGP